MAIRGFNTEIVRSRQLHLKCHIRVVGNCSYYNLTSSCVVSQKTRLCFILFYHEEREKHEKLEIDCAMNLRVLRVLRGEKSLVAATPRCVR